MRESEWQERVRRHLNRPGSGMRVWRQNAGKWRALRPWGSLRRHIGTLAGALLSLDRKRIETALTLVSDWVHGAPKGAADLSGLISGGQRLEVECKVDEPWSAVQKRWAHMIGARGGLYVLAKYDPSSSIEDNLAMVEDRIREGARVWRQAA